MKDSKGSHDSDGSELDKETISLHDQFSTQLSLSSSNDVVMNRKEGATSTGPDKVVSSGILHWPLKSLKQDATEEEAVKWRLEKNGFPFVLSDSEFYADSSNGSSVSEQSSVISSPTLHSETRSDDLDRTDIWVSSIDLDAEDSALLPDKEQFLDIFSSDFPSPSFSAVRSLQFCPSSSTPGTSQRKEANDSDEPIFWPFERMSYNSPEFDKFLSLSPRKSTTMDIGHAEVCQLNPVLQRLHKNKLSSANKIIGTRGGTTSLGAKGNRASQDKIQKGATVPSRLSRTTKACASSKHQLVSNCERKRPTHLKIGTPGKIRPPQMRADKPLQEKIEAGDIQKLAEKKSLIEELIGLDEFDGHEGIGSDFSDYQFSLWLSPR